LQCVEELLNAGNVFVVDVDLKSYFDTIPTIVHPAMLVWVTIGAILIAVMASVLPSIRAARMHPVEALRYE